MKKKPKTAKRKAKAKTQKITTFLTFSEGAEDAVKLYVSLFKNSRIVDMVRLPGDAPGMKGKVMVATFELAGQPFTAMNAGPSFGFAQGISLFVSCDTQQEIDRLWEKLSAGGEQQPCGWLRDRWGVSWQIVPTALGEMMGDPDSGNSQKVMEALLQMGKIDIKTLKDAYKQR